MAGKIAVGGAPRYALAASPAGQTDDGWLAC
jgi:hypothetical protein